MLAICSKSVATSEDTDVHRQQPAPATKAGDEKLKGEADKYLAELRAKAQIIKRADMSGLAPIAISMGEPAGIGPDLILKLYADRAEHDIPPFVVFGNLAFLAARARRLGLNINFAQTGVADAHDQFPVSLPVVHIDGLVPDKPGDTSPLSGKLVMEAISRSVAETLAGNCRALVTAPIHKAALYNAGFKYPGHTEYPRRALRQWRRRARLPVMMLAA